MTDTDAYDSIDPENYYDRLGEAEFERLDGPLGTFEFENTTDYLDARLPESGHVLDAGGAAGRYAVWLAERGYDVTLCDVSAEQLRVAREKLAERGLSERVAVERADIRSLPYSTGAFDAVCCLGGPLSHVTDGAERERAAAELRRVARPGAPAFVSVMGFLAVARRLVQVAPDFEAGTRQLRPLVESRTYDRALLEESDTEEPTFVACHFFRALELRELLARAGFDVDTVAGLEGIAADFEESLDEADAAAVERIEAIVTDPEFREKPAVADMSNHILAVGHAR